MTSHCPTQKWRIILRYYNEELEAPSRSYVNEGRITTDLVYDLLSGWMRKEDIFCPPFQFTAPHDYSLCWFWSQTDDSETRDSSSITVKSKPDGHVLSISCIYMDHFIGKPSSHFQTIKRSTVQRDKPSINLTPSFHLSSKCQINHFIHQTNYISSAAETWWTIWLHKKILLS